MKEDLLSDRIFMLPRLYCLITLLELLNALRWMPINRGCHFNKWSATQITDRGLTHLETVLQACVRPYLTRSITVPLHSESKGSWLLTSLILPAKSLTVKADTGGISDACTSGLKAVVLSHRTVLKGWVSYISTYWQKSHLREPLVLLAIWLDICSVWGT